MIVKCVQEMPSRQQQVILTLGLGLISMSKWVRLGAQFATIGSFKGQDTDVFLSTFGVALGSHNFFIVSFVDPFFVGYIIYHQFPSTDSTSKFYDIHGIQGCLW